MNQQNQPSKNSLNYKLKPISLIVFSLFSQQVFAQSELAQNNVPLELTQQLAESNLTNSTNNKKQAKILVAEASTAIKAISNTKYKPNTKYQSNTTADSTPDVDDVLFGDDPKPNKVNNNLPTTADRYGATKEILKTAIVSDAQAQSTGKMDSHGKPIGNAPVDISLKAVTVRAKRFHEIGPLPGLGLTKEEIPGNVQSITAKEIKESHSLSLTDLMNKKLQSVNVNDYQGNPFQMDVTYRGFTAGPQIGTPQGLSVFLDGIRVNEPFGDVVNWDMLPMNAIAGVDVFPGSNPIFGLNTLGGAFTLKTKDGFSNEGVDAEVLTGSYGRKQLQVEGGINNGEFALFGAGNFFLEDGWRKNSPSKVNQLFTKGSYRGEKLDLSLSTLLVQTDLVGNGLLPSEMYAQDHTSVFTSPDTTKNRLAQFQLSGAFQVNDTFSITGQAYRRNSKRHQIGADVYTDYDELKAAKSVPSATDGYTCMLKSTSNPTDGSNPNVYGIPDYLVIPINRAIGEQFDASPVFNDWANNNGVVDLAGTYSAFKNTTLPDTFVAGFKQNFDLAKNFAEQNYFNRGAATTPQVDQIDFAGTGTLEPAFSFGNTTFTNNGGYYGAQEYFPNENILLTAAGDAWFSLPTTPGIQYFVVFLAPVNNATCAPYDPNSSIDFPGPYNIPNPDNPGFPRLIDGFAFGEPGWVEGTPTAVITDNNINQIVDGASIQFNWNLEHHKFMVGASIDAASATYTNTQQLGFLDANRNAFLAPDLANPQFGAADIPIANNDFSGKNTTESVYFSETWSPVEAWHFNASGRYNQTHGKNKIAARYGFGAFQVGDVRSAPDNLATCTTDAECNTPRNYHPLSRNPKTLDAPETEKFSYYSFNPSLGATWQAKENLNIFANWAKGTRTPSVIELGCALDHTPTGVFYSDGQGGTYELSKSLHENRQCTLPSTLSGDPYLKQIKATTYDVGMRGSFAGLLGTDGLEWNLGAYQTDLKDDIYFIAVGNGQGFFDNVGKTRRRGIEAGLSGKKDKWGFGINYGLTDATFQDNFAMISNDNSSATYVPILGNGIIGVKPGDRMPGVPLHNLNANLSYEVTPKWQVGLSAVVHSESFLRGNENNQHQQGVTRYVTFTVPNVGPVTVARQPTTNPGKVPGYATFNLQTSYKFNSEWMATMQVNNLFDKEYFSAGRLGRNPFSPSINGAIGPDGYNHNSGDWLSTNFIAPSAPRGVWFSLNWQFDPNKK